jgi:hypothetical protein
VWLGACDEVVGRVVGEGGARWWSSCGCLVLIWAYCWVSVGHVMAMGGGGNMVVVVVVWGRGGRGGGGEDIPCISSFATKAFDDIMTTSRDRLPTTQPQEPALLPHREG